MKISIYDKITDTQSQSTIDINDFLRDIKEGRWQDQVITYRRTKSEQQKKNSPNVTISGQFSKRGINHLTRHSGFIALDIDDVKPEEVQPLRSDEYCYALFQSIGGYGYCAIFRIDTKLHDESWRELGNYLRDKYGIFIDPACKDVSRTRFVSWDPDIHINWQAKKWQAKRVTKENKRPDYREPIATNEDDFERVWAEVIARGLDLTSDYSDWVALGFMLKDKFTEAEAEARFQSISQFHPEYDHGKTQRKFRSLLKGGGTGRTTEARFFWLAKNAGINIKSDRTAKIERIARIVKKNGAPIAEIDKQLQTEGESTLTDNERRFAEAVKVDAPDKDRDTIGETRAWLNLKRDIWKCNIRNRFYDGDEPINDSHINMLWELINADGIKASKDVVTNLVTSKLAKVKDPLREFFEHNQEEGTDLILKLCQCVPTDDPEWRDIALIRWLMGTMETLYVRPVPYCPVLTGEQETGKTSFSRYLLPPELSIFYVESTLNEGKDSMIQLTENFIILNDEFTVKDMNHYKNLLSKSKVKVRAPYGRFEEERPRIGNLIGTSNEDEIIEDHTGNRRIFPIKVTGMIDFKLYESIDKKRLWGQVFHCWVNKVYPVELSRSEREKLANMTKSYQVTELLDDYLESIYEHDEENFTPTVHIYEELKDRFKQQITKASLGRAMRRAGFQKVREKDGQRRWGYAISKRHELPTPTEEAPF